MRTVDVCVCTFRRPSIADTLRSLAAQHRPDGVAMAVIVADNDETPSARPLVEATARETGLPVTYLHAPARNISLARNAALEASRAGFVAILDDDERADPSWLAELLATADAEGADVVLGPVVAAYAPDHPAWMRRNDFHSTRPVVVGGAIRTGYTSNVLFRREAPALAGQRFRLDLGRSGGEDTEFFDRAFHAGARIAFAPDAIVREDVEAHRATLRWLVQRKFRSGQSHGMLLASRRPGLAPRLAAAGVAGGKLALCAAMTAATAPFPERRAFWALRGALHAGVVSRLFGVREITQYGGDRLAAR